VLALAYMADSESSAASRFRQLSVQAFPLGRSQYFGAGGM